MPDTSDLGPSSLDERYALCQSLIRSERFSEAEAHLVEALDQHPRAAQSVHLLGIVLLLQRRFAEARVVIDRAFQLKNWVRSLSATVYDLRPVLCEARSKMPDWTWVRYELERERFFTVGLTMRNVVKSALSTSDVYFVQVGANVGGLDDPIYTWVREHHWRGILVEPLPDAFEALKHNYEDDTRLTFVNAAISETDGERSLFVDCSDSTGLASFVPERNVLGKKAPAQLAERRVECVTFATLFDRVGVDQVDLLQIDTEGYDYQVLRQFDFGRFRPLVVNIELYCLPIEERLAAFTLLGDHGYAYRFDDRDLLAVDRRRFGEEFCIVERAD